MRERKETYYVCVGINLEGNLCTLQCEALNKVDAIRNFEHKYNFVPNETFGPFGNRREYSKRKIANVKFSTNSYEGIYKDWYVVVTELKSPKNYVFVMFERPVVSNNNKQSTPESEIIHFTQIKMDKI